MKTAFWSLLRLYFNSIYGFKPLSEYRQPKDWLKLAGMILLFLLIVADFGFIFVVSALAQYAALKPQGLEGLLLLNASILSSAIVFVLGFIMALSTFSLSAAEQSLLALPLRSRSLLAAKFIIVYLSEFLFAFFLIGVNAVVFGINEGPPWTFYLYGAIIAIALPLIPLGIAYFIIVPLMSLARFMRNKNAVLIFAGVLGIGFALLFNLYIQGSMTKLADQKWIIDNYAGPDTILNLVGSAWPPSALAWTSLSAAAAGRWLEGLAAALALLASGIALAALAILALAKSYSRALLDFGEGVFKRLDRGETARYIGRAFKRRPLFLALMSREIRLMNREPIYFMNGPFIVILMPIIIFVMYIAQGKAFSELATLLDSARQGPYGVLAAAAFGAFLGSSTSIACTALSRDAKALPYLKALPISARAYMMAKLGHGLVFAVFGAVVGSLCLGLIVGLGALEILAALFIALAFSSLLNLAGLWMDTAHPRLAWDSPVAALKQNPNSVFSILGAMVLLGSLGFLATILPLDTLGFTLAYGVGSMIFYFLLLLTYPKFAERCLDRLEI